jgi:hypothetical protein
MTGYGRLCGWTLARAHTRTGDRIAIAAYLGGSDTFDQGLNVLSQPVRLIAAHLFLLPDSAWA